MNGLLVSAGILLVILKWFGVIDWQWNHINPLSIKLTALRHGMKIRGYGLWNSGLSK